MFAPGYKGGLGNDVINVALPYDFTGDQTEATKNALNLWGQGQLTRPKPVSPKNPITMSPDEIDDYVTKYLADHPLTKSAQDPSYNAPSSPLSSLPGSLSPATSAAMYGMQAPAAPAPQQAQQPSMLSSLPGSLSPTTTNRFGNLNLFAGPKLWTKLF